MVFKVVPILLLVAVVFNITGFAQCTELGQTPQTAFPVCGSNVFMQSSVPPCVNNDILVQGCTGDGALYQDINPYWYKFTCFKAGSLVFSIAPNAHSDDYDWEIFDITNRSLDDVYSHDPAVVSAIFVACNWSARSGPPSNGVTGTTLTAAKYSECATITGATDPPPLSKAPLLKLGHNYLLMISHFSGDNQSGYGLSFGGGTASITDTTPPRMVAAVPTCTGKKIGIKLNKKMNCASLADDGSDFEIYPAAATVIAAKANVCSSGFDMDSVVITLSNDLPDGHYKVLAKIGKDNNTVQDICMNTVPVGDSLPFNIQTTVPVAFDSIAPVACAPQTLSFVFKKRVRCSSIAPDGSDFTIKGPYPVTIQRASASCDEDGLSNIINVQLSQPLYLAGTYRVSLVSGTDGNEIIDECALQTQPGQTLSFTVKDTVSATFSSKLMLGCRQDSIKLSHDGAHGVNSWQWIFDGGAIDSRQALTRSYSDYGTKTVSLTVSNGFCSAASTQSFALDNQIIARFNAPVNVCPGDKAVFIDSSYGKLSKWSWYFGNGNTSSAQNPEPQLYPTVTRDRLFSVQLVVSNDIPCSDTTYKMITVLYNCYIAVPSAFTPNGDGLNDYLYPMNAYKATNLEFRVYNRWGQQVFETRDWTRKWDGTINGVPQAPGVFAWYLSYTNTDNQQKYFLKGTTVLIR